MKFQDLVEKAKEVKNKYREIDQKRWTATEYTEGLVGDVGDLMKLVMAKNGFRKTENLDEKLLHELSDCLWSILVIADELQIDLETEFMKQMEKLEEKVEQKKTSL